MTDAEFAALSADYDEAFAEWEGSEDAALWETTIGDGLDGEEGWDEEPGAPSAVPSETVGAGT